MQNRDSLVAAVLQFPQSSVVSSGSVTSGSAFLPQRVQKLDGDLKGAPQE